MNIAKRLPSWTVYALLAYMPFHIFLAQSLSLITGGLSVWKVSKDVLLFMVTAGAIGLVYARRAQTKQFNLLLGLSAIYGLVHLLVWGLNRDIFTETALLGTAYNVRVVGYLVLGYAAVLLWPSGQQARIALRIILIVSTIVSFLAILQYLLPKDLLTNFGYSLERGVRPAFFIDDKPDLPRVMSTLRDPNSLGAYLLLPICLLVARFQKARPKTLVGGLLLAHGLALFLTFSRAAWIGLVIMLGSFVVITFGRNIDLAKHRKKLVALLAAAVILVSFGYVFRDQYVVQNIILHSDETTQAELDSNDLHIKQIVDSSNAILDHPYGHGPGTAGIVSIRNPDQTFLTENYFLQIGYEIGLLGLLIFLVICFQVARSLVRRHNSSSRSLLAVLLAYSVMAIIMHLWTNEAVTAQWWLLAGVILGSGAPKTLSKKATT